MTPEQEHAQQLNMILDEMLECIKSGTDAQMFNLLLVEFCEMDHDAALRTLFWLREDPVERAVLMIVVNS